MGVRAEDKQMRGEQTEVGALVVDRGGGGHRPINRPLLPGLSFGKDRARGAHVEGA